MKKDQKGIQVRMRILKKVMITNLTGCKTNSV